MIDTLIAEYPRALQAHLTRGAEQLNLEREHPAWADILAMLCASDYVLAQWLRYMDLLPSMLSDSTLSAVQLTVANSRWLKQLLTCDDVNGVKAMLREYRHRHLCRIAWRDITQEHIEISTILKEQSALADWLIAAAYQWAKRSVCKDHNIDNCSDMIILALGKLGGYELNFSSDVDLIFLYPDDASTNSIVAPEQVYRQIGQLLIKLLHSRTQDGFVYRVDMRLRPFGNSGALVPSCRTALQYYQEHGRAWERYALIKARAITGDATTLLQLLQPFIYRPYVDFNMRPAIRNMHNMIVTEVRRKRLQDHIKLGAGGIREIEFIAQSLQLIYAGQHQGLQRTELKATLSLLAKYGVLDVQAADELQQCYQFWRILENRLQMLQDNQTHAMPSATLAQARVAWSMKQTFDELQQQITHCRRIVRHYFDTFIPQSDGEQEMPDCTQDNWQSLLMSRGYRKANSCLQHKVRKLLGLLEQIIGDDNDRAQLIEQLANLLINLLQRATYIDLLLSYEASLTRLVDIVKHSPWLYQTLCRQPMLLTEVVINDDNMPWQRDRLASYLSQQIVHHHDDDEAVMERLRREKQLQTTRIAIADLYHNLPIMRVSDYLTELAEVILQHVQEQAWRHVIAKYGLPQGLYDHQDHGLAVIAYGKLGGVELAYESDLDVVFLYQHEDGYTQGEQVLSHAQFYARIARRMIHMLNTQTYNGKLYEIDLRLRPSGGSGLLVTSLAAFKRYQYESAWTWEHQAILRARPVSGNPILQQQFKQIRSSVLCQYRDITQLKHQVIEMRNKMREHQSRLDQFDLRQAPGGIIDLEFIVQFLVLAHAYRFPELVEYSDNIRQLEAIAATGVLPHESVEQLMTIYRQFRNYNHRESLTGQAVNKADVQAARQVVRQVWQDCLA